MYLAASVNKPGQHVPYMYKDRLHITGLPDDIVFERPSSYGTEKLLQIIEAKDTISIKGAVLIYFDIFNLRF